MPKAKSGQLNGKKKKGAKQTAATKAYVSQSKRVTNSGPRISQSGSLGDIRVCHEEYVGTITGSVAFAATAYEINPGNPILFPWLAQIAARYESYRFNKLQVRLNARCATSTIGIQVLTVDYDASDPAPTSMVQARAYRSCVADVPWQHLMFSAVGEDLHKAKTNYVRVAASQPAGTDIKLYDVGNLFVIREGQASTDVISEVVVTYDVSLMTPQQDGLSGLSASTSGSAGLTASVLFGTNAVVDTDSTLPITINAAGDTVTFEVACELLASGWLVGTTLVGTFTNAGTATCTTLNAVLNSAGTQDMGLIRIVASAGQTWKPAITSAAAVSTSTWKITSYPANI